MERAATLLMTDSTSRRHSIS